jgi:hypothetical protein
MHALARSRVSRAADAAYPVQPQYVFVQDRDGRLLIDKIGCVEEMQQSYDEICRKI